jgi:hypothetical protein
MFLGPWMMEQRGGEWKELKSTGNEAMLKWRVNHDNNH